MQLSDQQQVSLERLAGQLLVENQVLVSWKVWRGPRMTATERELRQAQIKANWEAVRTIRRRLRRYS